MAADSPKPDPRVIVAYLDDIELGPSNDEALTWIKTIAGLTEEARAAFAKGPT